MTSATYIPVVFNPFTATILVCNGTKTASQATPNGSAIATATATATSTSKPAQYTGAAGRVAAGFGSAIGLAVAALAAL
jgi:hypothetical protein